MSNLVNGICFGFSAGVVPLLCVYLEEFRNKKIICANDKEEFIETFTTPSLTKRITLEPAYVLFAVAASIELLVRIPFSLISLFALKLFKPKENSLSYSILALSVIAMPMTFFLIVKSVQNLYYNLVKKDPLNTKFSLSNFMDKSYKKLGIK